MASSMLLSPLAPATAVENREAAGPSSLIQRSSFLAHTKLKFSSSTAPFHLSTVRRCFYRSPVAKSLDHIPKRFREENLVDGLMDNYKNVPPSLYGLNPSQLNMFMTEDNLASRQAERVTEESISAAASYVKNAGMWSLKDMKKGSPAKYSMKASMYRGGYGRPRSAPPDLPSYLLDGRVVYLGMPIVPAVTELIVAQFMWLDFDNQTKPIYLYINSPGTQNADGETVGSEGDAYIIADCMAYCKAKVYTINCGMAYGQAGMLLSLGEKGYRSVQPSSGVLLHLPQVYNSSGAVSDMWYKAKEFDVATKHYLEFLSKGTGKPEEEIKEYLDCPRYFGAKEAIEYGIADKIISTADTVYEKQNYQKILTQTKDARKSTGDSLPAPSGSR